MLQNYCGKVFYFSKIHEKNKQNKVYFAVAKKGEPPLDGKTDTDPEGLSAVNAGGKWAREVHWRLTSSDLVCVKLG